jgi:hypothetical protein
LDLAGPSTAAGGETDRRKGRDDRDGEDDVVRKVRRVLGPTYGSTSAGVKGELDQLDETILAYPGVAIGIQGELAL